MILLKNIILYSPEKCGRKDILIGGTQILQIEDFIPEYSGLEHIIECSEMFATPGFIDAHVHIAGAGGEGGPKTRTIELSEKLLIEGGITTVIGCLGTDGITRNPESVLMKVKAIRQRGLSAWMYTGSYQVPTPTLFGDVAKDIALIEEIIGVGEIAISDHRASNATINELAKIAAGARVGAMLGGKAGIVNLHMGDAKNPFAPIIKVVETTELNYKQFLPTHCNRNNYIFEDAKVYGKQGYIDITTSSYPYFPEYEIKPSLALKELLKAGVPIEHITFTSDANGSLPEFNDRGELVKIEIGKPDSILREIKEAVFNENIEIETAIKTVTSNIANILKLNTKGKIAKNMDADIIIFDKNFNIKYLIAMGKFMVYNAEIIVKF